MTAFASYPPRAVSARTRWQALGMAATIEIAIVAAVIVGAARHVQRDEPTVLSVNLMTPTTSVSPPAPAKPDVPPPRARPVPVPQVALPALQDPVPPTPTPPVTPPQLALRNAEPDVPVVVPHAPPPPAAASAALSSEYIARVRAAVKAAFEYPMAAKAQDFKGRARVAFSLVDTRPSGARIEVASGMGIVDRAALKAVEGASYPPAPEGIGHVDQAFEVWVGFVE